MDLYKSIDDILDRYAAEQTAKEPPMKREELEKALTDTTRNSREYYRCDSDHYTVVFEPLSGKAAYQFDHAEGGIDQVISRGQLNYYLDTGYWQPALPSEA